jgi:hypothetical protein
LLIYMSFFNRENLSLLNPIPRGIPGNNGEQGEKGIEWQFSGSTYWLPGERAIRGSTLLPGLTGLTSIEGDGINKWIGGVLSTNGFIYCVPYVSDYILKIDPINNIGFTNIEGLTGLTNREDFPGNWYGGVLANNGYIYCVPHNSDKVLKINPFNDTYEYPIGLTGITVDIEGERYAGGVLAPNGKIYCVPNCAAKTLVIDPNSDTYEFPNGLTIEQNDYSYSGGVLAPNGKIYYIPHSNDYVYVVDPITNTGQTNIIGLTGINTDTNSKYLGGVLAPNGKIYCVPLNSNNVLVIDPETNTGRTDYPGLTGFEGFVKWAGGVLAPNGKIYCIPHNATNVLVIDPETNTGTTMNLGMTGIVGTLKYLSGVLAPNGKIYSIPFNTGDVLRIDPGLPKYVNWTWMLDPYFNKY